MSLCTPSGMSAEESAAWAEHKIRRALEDSMTSVYALVVAAKYRNRIIDVRVRNGVLEVKKLTSGEWVVPERVWMSRTMEDVLFEGVHEQT